MLDATSGIGTSRMLSSPLTIATEGAIVFATTMFAVVYTWAVKPGNEDAFVDAWHRATIAIMGRCSSYGSRLHRADDGTFVGYARWPSERARLECFADGPPDTQAAVDMGEAIERTLPERRLEILDDLLAEP